MAVLRNIKDPSNSLFPVPYFSSGAFATRSRRRGELHQVEIQNSLRSVSLIQVFFPGDKAPEFLEALAREVKGGQSLREAFGTLAQSQQQEIQKRVGSSLEEILSLARNQNEASFWEDALQFGVRLKQAGKMEASAGVLGLLSHGEGSPEVKQQATLEYNAVIGVGRSEMRAEVILANLIRQENAAGIILPMIGASVLGQVAGTVVLGRLAGRTANFFTRRIGADLLAGAASFTVEMPVFAMGARYLSGGAETEVMDDIWRAGTSLGAMRAFGFLGRQGFLKLHKVNEAGAALRLGRVAKFTQAALPQVSMFGGMMGAHELEGRWHLRPKREGETVVSDILGSMASLQVGAAAGKGLLGRGVARFREEMRSRANQFAKYGETNNPGGLQPILSALQGNVGAGLVPARSIGTALSGRGPSTAGPLQVLPKPFLMARSSGGNGANGSGGGMVGEFKVGETNPTEVIRAATSINNQPVEVLEARLREAKLLGPTESLLEILAGDNDYIFSRDLNHQRVAAGKDVLWAKSTAPISMRPARLSDERPIHRFSPIDHSGSKFLFLPEILEEPERSPLADHSSSPASERGSRSVFRQACNIINLNLGRALCATDLQWELIRAIGFYGGRESKHRLEPAAILGVLDFLVRQSCLTLRPPGEGVGGVEATDLPTVASHFGSSLPPEAQRNVDSWAVGILAGAEAWSPYQRFLSVNFQASRIVDETMRRFDQAFAEAGDSPLYQALGLGPEMQDQVRSSLYLVFAAETNGSGTNLGFLDFIDPDGRVAFDEHGLGRVLQHPLRNFLTTGRGKRLSPDAQADLIHEAAGGDLVLLSILALLASRGQPWAIEGLRGIEEEREAALLPVSDLETLRAPLALEMDLGRDGQGHQSSGDALMMQAHALAMQSEVVRLLGGSEDTLPPDYVASLLERVHAGDYQALVSLAFLAARFTEAQESLEGLAGTYDADKYERQILSGSYSALFFLAGANSARALRELAQEAERDSEAAQLMATLARQNHAEARRVFAGRDLSRLFPDGLLTSNHIWWAHHYWQAGNEWSGRRLASGNVRRLILDRILQDPTVYSSDLSHVILAAHAGNAAGDGLLEKLYKHAQGNGESNKAHAARKGLKLAVSSESAALQAAADLARQEKPWAVATIRSLDPRSFSARAFHDPQVLAAMFTMEEIGHPAAGEALAQLYDLLFKAATGRPPRPQDYPSQPELARAVTTMPPPECAQRFSDWTRLTLQHYGDRHHLPNLEREVDYGLDPAGMLAVPNTREKVVEIASALGASMDDLTELAHKVSVADVERASWLREGTSPAIQAWMVLAHLSHVGEKAPSGFLDDTARLLRDLNDAALDPRAAVATARADLIHLNP